MEASKKNINDIFNGARILEIPFYQRSYVWKEEQWKRLLSDMEFVSATNKPYFLGSVILKQQPTSSANNIGDIRTVIDGQQRLTTLNLFIKTLCLLNDENAMFDRIFRLMNNDISLLHNHNDISFFNQIIELTELIEIDNNSIISKAYTFFKNNIDTEKININKILANIMFVGVDLGSDEDEQQIFDTINSLGVRLTTAELLKNYLFNRDDIHSYESNWKEIFEKDDEVKEFWDKEVTAGRQKKENIDLFFYAFLLIKIHNKDNSVSSEDKILYSKVDNLFSSYKSYIEKYCVDKNQFISEIKEYAIIYMNNIDFNVVESELSDDFGINRINAIIFGLENTTIVPYSLFILKHQTDDTERNKLFEFIETYLMRRMICHANTKNYNQLFSERFINNNILTVQEMKEYIENQSDKVNYLPSDLDLEHGFNYSKLTNKQTAGILYFIESKIRNRNTQSTSLLGLKKYSLEHVLPKKWENNWGSLNSEEERLERNRILLTMGNLTIITSSLNTSISDADWETKKIGRNGKHGLKTYAVGIETFSNYIDEDEWNEEIIKKRAKYLCKKAKNIWKI